MEKSGTGNSGWLTAASSVSSLQSSHGKLFLSSSQWTVETASHAAGGYYEFILSAQESGKQSLPGCLGLKFTMGLCLLPCHILTQDTIFLWVVISEPKGRAPFFRPSPVNESRSFNKACTQYCGLINGTAHISSAKWLNPERKNTFSPRRALPGKDLVRFFQRLKNSH